MRIRSAAWLMCIIALLCLGQAGPAGATDTPLTEEDVKSLPHDAIESRLAGQHPVTLYIYASRLQAEGRHDEAAFWFYAGQLRGRVLQDVRKDKGLGIALGAYQVGLGGPINDRLRKSPESWTSLIDKVLHWDRTNDNAFTAYADYKNEYDGVRKGLEELKSVIAGFASPSPPPVKTSLGHPVYTAPFPVGENDAPSATYWIGNDILAYNDNAGIQLWNVASGKVEYVEGRRISCVSNNVSPPIVSLYEGKLVPRDGRHPSGFQATERLIGAWGSLQPHPAVLTDDVFGVSRTHTLRSGAEVKQWATTGEQTNCFGRWLPDDEAPQHMVAAMQNQSPKFGGSVVVDIGLKEPEKPVTVYVADRPTPIQLPIRRCEVESYLLDQDYYVFKRAYLIWSGYGGKCEEKRAFDKPRRYWWLFANGTLEAAEVPSHVDTRHTARRPGDDYIPTAAGFVYDGLGSTKYTRALVLIKEGKFFNLLEAGQMSLRYHKVSPDGCRFVFATAQDPRGAWRLQVVDLCRPQSETSTQ